MGKRRGANPASWRRAHEDLRPRRREMLRRAAKNRGHHARKDRRPLNKKKAVDQSMSYFVATSQVKPELRDAFIQLTNECITSTLNEKGCTSYESNTRMNDPNLY